MSNLYGTEYAKRKSRIHAAMDRLGPVEKKILRDALCQVDPVAWVRIRLGVVPDPWQRDLMRAKSDVVALCGRRTGKSQAAAWSIAHHVSTGADRTGVLVSPGARQSGEIFRLAKSAIVKALPDTQLPTDNRTSLELPSGSRLISLPGDPDTVRGFTASAATIDESQSLPNAGTELLASIAPTLATTGGRLTVLGTPLDRSGLLFDLWHSDDPAWQRIHVPTTLCPRVSEEFLERERRLLGEAIYRRGYLAEFAASSTGMFDPELLQAALLPEGFDFAAASAVPMPPSHPSYSTPNSARPSSAIDTGTRGSRYDDAVLPAP